MKPTRRPALAAVLALGLLASSTHADVAGAQDAPSPPSSDPAPSTSAPAESTSSSAAPDTSAIAPTTVSTTASEVHERPEADGATTTTGGASTTAVTDTTVAPPPPDGVVEGQTESVPIVAPGLVDLPVRGSRPARVVAGVPARVNALISEAKDAYDETVATLDEAESRNAVTTAELAQAQARVDRLSIKERAALDQLSEARRLFETRVQWAYTRGPTVSLEGYLQSRDAEQLTDRRLLVQFVLEQDTDAVHRYLDLRDSVDSAVSSAEDMLSAAQHAHATTQIAEDAARDDVALTTLTLGLWNRTKKGMTDLVFPVIGPHAFGSDFGAPRMVGTPYEHKHEGNDIAAPLGAELVSVEPGMVVAMGTDRLGGIKLWLAGRSGTYYYYAHLSKFADNVHEGDIVPAGFVVGFVGNTGNAAGGIPHLHFEIHPNGGPAVDPYPYLVAADRRQRLAKWP